MIRVAVDIVSEIFYCGEHPTGRPSTGGAGELGAGNQVSTHTHNARSVVDRYVGQRMFVVGQRAASPNGATAVHLAANRVARQCITRTVLAERVRPRRDRLRFQCSSAVTVAEKRPTGGHLERYDSP